MCLKLLIVDDNKDTAVMLSRLLLGCGYESDTAYSGEEALVLAGKHHYDMAILDYCMPIMNGVQLLIELHKTQPDMEAVMITGRPNINMIDPSIREGVLRVFQKPIPFEELLPILEEHDHK